MSETKLEKFQRLFQKRIEKAMDAARLVGNLNSPNYEIDPEMVAHAVTTFEEQWRDVRVALGLPAVSTTAAAIQSDPPYGGTGWELMDKAYNALSDGDAEKAKKFILAGFSA